MIKINWKKIDFSWFNRRRRIYAAVIALIGLFILYWRDHKPPPEPRVTVAYVEQQTVPIFYDYVGTTDSVRTVDIRARVEGFLIERNFTEGKDVKKNDLLYIIDPKPFEAALEGARAQLAKDQAALAFANEQVGRYQPLVEKEYISKQDFDKIVTTSEEVAAAVEADKAAVTNAELNLGYCKMYAPFNGRIGRTLVHEGNLVGAAGQDTKLAILVQLDPIYVYFSPSDEDIYRILEAMKKAPLKVDITFSDGTKYKQQGTVDFVNNEVDPKTSTVTMRAVFRNPDKTLLPGIYVQSRVYLETIPDALTVPEKAVAGDHAGSYVLVVDDDDKVEKRPVTLGVLHDGTRVITQGVKKGEKVIIDGLQIAKVGSKVNAVEATGSNTMQDVVQQALGLKEKK